MRERKFKGEDVCYFCAGSGLVKAGLYDTNLDAFASRQLVMCKKCHGRSHMKDKNGKK